MGWFPFTRKKKNKKNKPLYEPLSRERIELLKKIALDQQELIKERTKLTINRNKMTRKLSNVRNLQTKITFLAKLYDALYDEYKNDDLTFLRKYKTSNNMKPLIQSLITYRKNLEKEEVRQRTIEPQEILNPNNATDPSIEELSPNNNEPTAPNRNQNKGNDPV